MGISFDTALGIHEQALHLRTRRATILANNLANVDTPNFKARDLDFKKILKQQLARSPSTSNKALKMRATNARHARGDNLDMPDPELQYRLPLQPSIDGNTVDEHMEQAEFMKNSMDFEFSYLFLNKRFKGLKSAIRGD